MPRGKYPRPAAIPVARVHYSEGADYPLCGSTFYGAAVSGGDTHLVTCKRCAGVLAGRVASRIALPGCSKHAIDTLAGSDVPDVPRMVAQVVREVESFGFRADFGPVRVWRGRKVSALAGVTDPSPLALVFCAGHVMPLKNGALSNLCGRGDEVVTIVAFFKKAD